MQYEVAHLVDDARYRRARKGLFAGVAVALAAFGLSMQASAQDSAAMAELIAAAKAEGALVLYSSESDNQVNLTNAAFREKYGISVQSTRLTAGALTSRYDGERQGNVILADVIVVANAPLITDNPDWWVDLNESVVPGYESYPETAKGEKHLTLNHNVIGIAWNTDLVGPEDAPSNYLDLVNNPAFESQGSIAYADPRATPSAMNLFKVLVETHGEEFFTKLRERGVAIAPSSSPGAQQVAAGANKALIGNFANNAHTVIAAGAPVAYVAVQDPATGVDNQLALSTGSANPNAARLYAAFRISEEGQRAMCEARGSTSPLGELPGCEPPVPANYIPTDFGVAQDREWQAKYLPWLGLRPL